MNLRKYSLIVLRISLSFLFLWFGFTSIFNYESLLGYLPSFAYSLSISLKTILLFNGIFEISFGLLLLLGFYVRISAILLSLHTLIIMLSIGYNDVVVRDFGIALAAFSVFLNGEDEWCLRKRLRKK